MAAVGVAWLDDGGGCCVSTPAEVIDTGHALRVVLSARFCRFNWARVVGSPRRSPKRSTADWTRPSGCAAGFRRRCCFGNWRGVCERPRSRGSATPLGSSRPELGARRGCERAGPKTVRFGGPAGTCHGGRALRVERHREGACPGAGLVRRSTWLAWHMPARGAWRGLCGKRNSICARAVPRCLPPAHTPRRGEAKQQAEISGR